MVNDLVTGTLLAKGLDVSKLGICPTPTVQFTVKDLNANGGIAISASHNPNEWNALKLLNSTGQFMTPNENKKMLHILSDEKNGYKAWDKIGKITYYTEGIRNHIDAVLNMKHIDLESIRRRKFKVLADCVNGAGVYVIPELLREFGCEVIELNCEKTGVFPRLPEPIPENLTDTMKAVKDANVDLGIIVDPDVDRLVLITNEGEPFGEENTITQVINFVLSKEKGNVVVNLSTTRAVDDVANAHWCEAFRSPVGEANVVIKMKEINAVTGIGLILQSLANYNGTIADLKYKLPRYSIRKRKIEIADINPDAIIKLLMNKYAKEKIDTQDGLRIDLENHWVHFRESNTEPIIRIITEARTDEEADRLVNNYLSEINAIIKNN
jgi:phosphomannomutase